MTPEMTVFYPYDILKEPPDGWRKLGKMDICPECAKTVELLKDIAAKIAKCDVH